MNILYYDPKTIKLPECTDSGDEEKDRGEGFDSNHFISISSNQTKGITLDIYVSIMTDI
jgi:hypothetical protein